MCIRDSSKVAADEIEVLSKKSVKVTEESSTLLSEIIPQIEKTAKMVQEITAASIEQNAGAGQVNNAIQQLNDITQQNATVSDEMANSAKELSEQADELKKLIDFFQTDIKSTSRESKKKTPVTQKIKEPSVSPQPHSKGNKGFNIQLGSTHKNDEFERF